MKDVDQIVATARAENLPSSYGEQRVDINVIAWFREANAYLIKMLAQDGFSGSKMAKFVLLSVAGSTSETGNKEAFWFIDSLERINKTTDFKVDFTVEINNHQALNWLEKNRPEVLKLINGDAKISKSASTEGLITATMASNDNVFSVAFNAAHWFKKAARSDIRFLDNSVHLIPYFVQDYGTEKEKRDIGRLFKYLDIMKENTGKEHGYVVEINKDQAIAWLERNRPDEAFLLKTKEYFMKDHDEYIPGFITPNNGGRPVVFNAVPWLKQASSDYVVQLANNEFIKANALDIAVFVQINGTEVEVKRVDGVFAYIEMIRKAIPSIGFEVSFNEPETMAWLEANRPDVVDLITANAPR